MSVVLRQNALERRIVTLDGELLLEGIRDVLEEDQAEHDVFVLGSVHVGSQRIGGPPEVAFKAEIRSVTCGGHATVSFWEWVPARSAGTSRSQQGREQFSGREGKWTQRLRKGFSENLGGIDSGSEDDVGRLWFIPEGS